MTVVVRAAEEADIDGIVAMLGEHWTQQGWSVGKYRYYYEDYPSGRPLPFVAVEDGVIVAFLGLLPIAVSGMPACLVLQVFVSPRHRRGATLVELARLAESTARESGARFLCGFGNRRFAAVAARFLGWRVPGYLRFVDREAVDLTAFRSRFHFDADGAWHRWRFGAVREIQTQSFEKDGVLHRQLLKTRAFPKLEASSLGFPRLNLWHPDSYSTTDDGGWTQPFVVVPLAPDLPPELLDIHHWYLEMGDSDAIEPYQPWLASGRLAGTPLSPSEVG